MYTTHKKKLCSLRNLKPGDLFYYSPWEGATDSVRLLIYQTSNETGYMFEGRFIQCKFSNAVGNPDKDPALYLKLSD